MNQKAWVEWSDTAPEPHMTGCIEGQYLNSEGRIAYAPLSLYHYIDERGSLWGHSTGSYRNNDYQTHHPSYYLWRYVGPPVPVKSVQGKAMLIWSFYDAPGELRCLSEHGGDEDWIALLPADMNQPSWMESGTSFGCCDVSEHELPDGRRVFIGAHA